MEATQETKAEEVKQMLEVFALAVEKMNNANVLDEVLKKDELIGVLRVAAWVTRFLHNTRTNHQRRVIGPLTTNGIETQTKFCIKWAKQQAKSNKQLEDRVAFLTRVSCRPLEFAHLTNEQI